MSRPLMLSNNQMLVGLNDYGLVHDFYFPYIGLENHASAKAMRHKIGVWVDGMFSWLDDGHWNIEMRYEPHSLIGITVAEHKRLKVRLEFHDFVAISDNAFIRSTHVINDTDEPRQINLFYHQVFQISESTRGDTAIYMPNDQIILDYKGKRAFTIYAEDNDEQPFDQYSIGNFGIEGKEGTFKDAEDGELSGNDIEHGQVDTVIRVPLDIEPHGSHRSNYWIAAGTTNADAIKVHKRIREVGVEKLLHEAANHWHKWLKVPLRKARNMTREHADAYIKSLLLVKSHIDVRGAAIASGDSQMLNYSRDYYSYHWPRDAAYNMLPLISLGYKDEPETYFAFTCGALQEEGYLLHKYLSDGSAGSSWHPALQHHHSELPIQEDETAITLYALKRYYDVSGDKEFIKGLYFNLIKPMAQFLADYVDEETGLPHASYDLWEEKFLTSTYTASVVYAALRAASAFAVEFGYPDDGIACDLAAEDIRLNAKKYLYDEENGYLRKGYLMDYDGRETNDDTLDVSSLYGVIEYGLFEKDDKVVTSTLKAIEERMLNQAPIGGVGRYEYDHYNSAHAAYKGNPWLVTSLWLAQIYMELDREDDARKLIEWSLKQQSKSGALPEQLHPETGEYISVAPLIWSQAELVRTLQRLYKI